MSTKIYKRENNVYLQSEAIQVFPCSGRGYQEQGNIPSRVFDPEAKYTTEHNLTAKSGHITDLVDSYIDNWGSAGPLICCIKGYYFNAKITLEELINSFNSRSFTEGMNLFAKIQLEKRNIYQPEPVTTETTNELTEALANQVTPGSTDLDNTINTEELSTYYFTGLSFVVAEQPPIVTSTNFIEYTLKLATYTDKWELNRKVCLDHLLKIHTNTGAISFNNCTATGDFAFAAGNQTGATGKYSHAEGIESKASGEGSHTEGYWTTVLGEYSHAEGYFAHANGEGSHAEGYWTKATGYYSHTEGYCNKTGKETELGFVNGYWAHAEGGGTIALGDYSHTEGWQTKTEGYNLGKYSHAEGIESKASGEGSHAEGYWTYTVSSGSHAEGYFAITNSYHSHAEGSHTSTSGDYSHAEGSYTITSSKGSHAEGSETKASGGSSHSEGHGTGTYGPNSHAEGAGFKLNSWKDLCDSFTGNIDGDVNSDVIATINLTKDKFSPEASKLLELLQPNTRLTLHLKGLSEKDGTIKFYNPESTILEVSPYTKDSPSTGFIKCKFHQDIKLESSNPFYDTLDYYTIQTYGEGSHAEGNSTITFGNASHSEGYNTLAIGMGSHAEGFKTEAIGDYSHAEGASSALVEYCSLKYNLTFLEEDSKHILQLDISGTSTNPYMDQYELYKLKDELNIKKFIFIKLASYSALNKFFISDTPTIEESNALRIKLEVPEYLASLGSSNIENILYIKNGHYAIGDYSTVTGIDSTAVGKASSANGFKTIASAENSHTEGYFTVANNANEFVAGHYNRSLNVSPTVLFEVGGTDWNDSYFSTKLDAVGTSAVAVHKASGGNKAKLQTTTLEVVDNPGAKKSDDKVLQSFSIHYLYYTGSYIHNNSVYASVQATYRAVYTRPPKVYCGIVYYPYQIETVTKEQFGGPMTDPHHGGPLPEYAQYLPYDTENKNHYPAFLYVAQGREKPVDAHVLTSGYITSDQLIRVYEDPFTPDPSVTHLISIGEYFNLHPSYNASHVTYAQFSGYSIILKEDTGGTKTWWAADIFENVNNKTVVTPSKISTPEIQILDNLKYNNNLIVPITYMKFGWLTDVQSSEKERIYSDITDWLKKHHNQVIQIVAHAKYNVAGNWWTKTLSFKYDWDNGSHKESIELYYPGGTSAISNFNSMYALNFIIYYNADIPFNE